ncbi:hypothetical protein GASC598B02_000330, partial [Gilliamella apicola SCGC AB-598-B02]
DIFNIILLSYQKVFTLYTLQYQFTSIKCNLL